MPADGHFVVGSETLPELAEFEAFANLAARKAGERTVLFPLFVDKVLAALKVSTFVD